MNYLSILLITIVFVSCKSADDKNKTVDSQTKEYGWALLPFQKADEVNPI
jgi:hypothetical protein